MPIDREDKIIEKKEKEKKPLDPHEGSVETVKPRDYIDEEAQELRVQIQHALEQLPGIHEEPAIITELEILKGELEATRAEAGEKVGEVEREAEASIQSAIAAMNELFPAGVAMRELTEDEREKHGPTVMPFMEMCSQDPLQALEYFSRIKNTQWKMALLHDYILQGLEINFPDQALAIFQREMKKIDVNNEFPPEMMEYVENRIKNTKEREKYEKIKKEISDLLQIDFLQACIFFQKHYSTQLSEDFGSLIQQEMEKNIDEKFKVSVEEGLHFYEQIPEQTPGLIRQGRNIFSRIEMTIQGVEWEEKKKILFEKFRKAPDILAIVVSKSNQFTAEEKLDLFERTYEQGNRGLILKDFSPHAFPQPISEELKKKLFLVYKEFCLEQIILNVDIFSESIDSLDETTIQKSIDVAIKKLDRILLIGALKRMEASLNRPPINDIYQKTIDSLLSKADNDTVFSLLTVLDLDKQTQDKCIDILQQTAQPYDIEILFKYREEGKIQLSPEQEVGCIIRYMQAGGILTAGSSSDRGQVERLQMFKEKIHTTLENPEETIGLHVLENLSAEVASEFQDSILKRIHIIAENGGKIIAEVVLQYINKDKDFSQNWPQAVEIFHHLAEAKKTLERGKFHSQPEAEKNITINSIIGAQETLSNKNLRLRLEESFHKYPAIFNREQLQSLPQESYPGLHLLRSRFLLSSEEIERFCSHMFSGQVLKKQKDKDRFFSFLVEVTEIPVIEKNLKRFVEVALPLMDIMPESKKKIFELSQFLRSMAFMEGDKFEEHLMAVNQELASILQKYKNILEQRKKEWGLPIEKEIETLKNEKDLNKNDDKLLKKTDQKLKKKEAQLHRGPEDRDLAEFKKEGNILAQEELEKLIKNCDELIPKLFAEKCGANLSLEEITKFLESFKEPQLVIIYLGKLEAYPHQKKLFQKFIESVAKGNLSETRYEYREHLDMIFAGDSEMENLWKANLQVRKEGEILSRNEVAYNQMAKQRIKEFITEALGHGHVTGEYKNALTRYLQSEDAEKVKIRRELQNQLAQFDSEKPKTAEQKRLLATYNTMKLLSLKGEQLREGAIREKNTLTQETVEKKIDDLLQEIKSSFPDHSPFINDIDAIKEVITNLKNESKTGESSFGLYAEESEKPDLMLRMGTDVIGSCQNVMGTPELNRNLISYMMDGKIKTIFVRDMNGEIVSRAIMRILYNERAKKPVIHLEHSYHRSGAPIDTSNDLLFTLAQQKAKGMGVDLVISGKLKANQELSSYTDDLISYGGPGDTEYVDTLRGAQNKQKYTIPKEKVYSVDLQNSPGVAIGEVTL